MQDKHIFTLGLGLTPPWQVADYRLERDKTPNELHLEVVSERAALFPCPSCGRACKAHDFTEFTWQHLSFFQHHCFITARVPRVNCPDHGVTRADVPWARSGSRFTLLFEQAALMLAREMPVAAAARYIGITDKRLWRVVQHYVDRAVANLDLSKVTAVGLDETASKKGHRYVTVFIDMDRRDHPVIFVTEGKGKAGVVAFRAFMLQQGGEPTRVAEVVCDMSGAFLAAVAENFTNAAVTVDWFHVVQLFTTAVDNVRKAEAQQRKLPEGTRWAILKAEDGDLTAQQAIALDELRTGGFATAEAHHAKEQLRWVRQAQTQQGARWRLTQFINQMNLRLDPSAPTGSQRDSPLEAAYSKLLDPLRTVLATVVQHADRIIQRWTSSHSSARLEAMNGIFKAVRARARGYRSTKTFMTMIYLIAAPLPDILVSI